MKRLIVALMVGGALFAGVAFAAASIPSLSAGGLSQGQANVSDCSGGNWVSLQYDIDGTLNPVQVISVKVTAPATCDGATASVELFDGAAGFEAGGACTLASGTCNADVVDTDATLVDWARVTLTGP
jgi:hypothetical protein